MASKQELCAKGHVLAEVGQTKSGWCLECKRAYMREYMMRKRREDGVKARKVRRLTDPIAERIRQTERVNRWHRKHGRRQRYFKPDPRAQELSLRTSTLIRKMANSSADGLKSPQIPHGLDLIWLVLHEEIWDGHTLAQS